MGFDIEKMFTDMAEKTIRELDAAKTAKEAAKVLSNNVLPQLKLVNNIFGRPVVAGLVKRQFNKAAADMRDGKMDAELTKYSRKLKSYTRDDIKDMLTEKLNSATDPAIARNRAEKAAQGLSDMSLAEFTDVVRASYAVLPPVLKSVYDRVLLDGRSVEDYARETFSMTIEQRVQKQMDVAAQMPVDALADYIHAQLQKAGPAEVKTAALSIMSRITADDAAGLVLDAMNVAEDSLKVIKDKNVLGVKDTKKAGQFGDRLKKIFTTVENGIIAAGLHDQKAIDAIIGKNFGNDNNGKPPKIG